VRFFTQGNIAERKPEPISESSYGYRLEIDQDICNASQSASRPLFEVTWFEHGSLYEVECHLGIIAAYKDIPACGAMLVQIPVKM
jgi:hypothetical protein